MYCAYVYVVAGDRESTIDLMFGGDALIAENGTILAGSEKYKVGIIYADIDVEVQHL